MPFAARFDLNQGATRVRAFQKDVGPGSAVQKTLIDAPKADFTGKKVGRSAPGAIANVVTRFRLRSSPKADISLLAAAVERSICKLLHRSEMVGFR